MKIGLHLILEFKQTGKKAEKYKCKVIDKTKDEIIIDYPVHTATMKTELFSVDTVFSVSYLTETNSIYQFPARIKRRVKLNVPGLALSLPEPDKFKRIQRREFVRVNASIDIALHKKRNEKDSFTTITTDISGGGASVIVPHTDLLNLGERFDLWMALPFKSGEIYYINSISEVVFLQSKHGTYTASVKFISLKPKDQEKIIRFCFEKQLEERKKAMT